MATKASIPMSQQNQPPPYHYFEHYQEAHRPLEQSSSASSEEPIVRSQFIQKPSVVQQVSSPINSSSSSNSNYFPNKPSVAVLNSAPQQAYTQPPHYQNYEGHPPPPPMYHSNYPPQQPEPVGFHPMYQQQANYFYYGHPSSPQHPPPYYYPHPSTQPPPPTGTNFYSMYPSLHHGMKQAQPQYPEQQQNYSQGQQLQQPPVVSGSNTPLSGNSSNNNFPVNNFPQSAPQHQRVGTPTSGATTPTSATTPKSSTSATSATGYIKITRNIRAVRSEKCEEPVEFPQSGVLYEFNVENWTNKMNFYDKIAYSFGVPSTQKVVFCHYLNCKVMHYERTCQGVYYCPSNEGNPSVPACSTVRPCRFRFQTCPVHQNPLKKSSNCKFKLHFYVPVEKDDFRRLLLCLGDHSHALLENDTGTTVTPSSSANTANEASFPNVQPTPSTASNTPASTVTPPSPKREDFANYRKAVNQENIVLESGSIPSSHNSHSNHSLPPFSYGPASANNSVHHEETTTYQIDDPQAASSHLFVPLYHNVQSNSGSNSNTANSSKPGTPIDFSTALQRFNPVGLSRKRNLSVLKEEDEQLQQEQEEKQNLLPNANSLIQEPEEKTEHKEQLLKKVKTEEQANDSLPAIDAPHSVNTPTSASREKLPSIKDLFNSNLYQ